MLKQSLTGPHYTDAAQWISRKTEALICCLSPCCSKEAWQRLGDCLKAETQCILGRLTIVLRHKFDSLSHLDQKGTHIRGDGGVMWEKNNTWVFKSLPVNTAIKQVWYSIYMQGTKNANRCCCLFTRCLTCRSSTRVSPLHLCCSVEQAALPLQGEKARKWQSVAGKEIHDADTQVQHTLRGWGEDR